MTKVLGTARHQQLREAIGVTCEIDDLGAFTARSSWSRRTGSFPGRSVSRPQVWASKARVQRRLYAEDL
eukprot:14825765-Heterocapsa_arctica.AAC.1